MWRGGTGDVAADEPAADASSVARRGDGGVELERDWSLLAMPSSGPHEAAPSGIFAPGAPIEADNEVIEPMDESLGILGTVFAVVSVVIADVVN